jgi:hypothetical protein
MRRERSVEFPQRQTGHRVRLIAVKSLQLLQPWVNSRNIRRSASTFSDGESLSEILNGSAKRSDNSNTASVERENVSH